MTCQQRTPKSERKAVREAFARLDASLTSLMEVSGPADPDRESYFLMREEVRDVFRHFSGQAAVRCQLPIQ